MMNGKPKYEFVEVDIWVTIVDIMHSREYSARNDTSASTERRWGSIDTSEFFKNIPPSVKTATRNGKSLKDVKFFPTKLPEAKGTFFEI